MRVDRVVPAGRVLLLQALVDRVVPIRVVPIGLLKRARVGRVVRVRRMFQGSGPAQSSYKGTPC
jgi:hypothetical protein